MMLYNSVNMRLVLVSVLQLTVLCIPQSAYADGVMSTISFHSQPEERLRIYNSRNYNDPLLWRDAIGRDVEAQGIAFNYDGKHPVPYVDLGSSVGTRIYIKGHLLSEHEAQGRLVQVRGKLRVEEIPPILSDIPISQPLNGRCYFIQVTEMRLIDRHDGRKIELRQ